MTETTTQVMQENKELLSLETQIKYLRAQEEAYEQVISGIRQQIANLQGKKIKLMRAENGFGV